MCTDFTKCTSFSQFILKMLTLRPQKKNIATNNLKLFAIFLFFKKNRTLDLILWDDSIFYYNKKMLNTIEYQCTTKYCWVHFNLQDEHQ